MLLTQAFHEHLLTISTLIKIIILRCYVSCSKILGSRYFIDGQCNDTLKCSDWRVHDYSSVKTLIDFFRYKTETIVLWYINSHTLLTILYCYKLTDNIYAFLLEMSYAVLEHFYGSGEMNKCIVIDF